MLRSVNRIAGLSSTIRIPALGCSELHIFEGAEVCKEKQGDDPDMPCKHLVASPYGQLGPQNNFVSSLMDAGSWGTPAIR